MPSRKRMSRDMRKNLIVAIVRDSPEPLRVLQIARAMGMKRTPYLVGVLDELVDEGWLAITEVDVHPDLVARAYIPARAPATE